MNYQEQKAANDAEILKARQDAADERALLDFFRKHAASILCCDANENILREYANGAPLAGLLDEAIQNPSLLSRLAKTTPEQDRQKVAEDYLSLVGGSPAAKAHEAAKIKWTETEVLRQKAESLRQRKELQQKSPAELRAIIKANKPQPVEKPLPPEHTRATILAMPPKDLRRLLDTYSNQAVMERLNQR